MPADIVVRTGRLLLRQLEPGDAEPLAQMWNDPEVTEFMGGPRDYNEIVRSIEEDLAAGARPTFDELWPLVEIETEKVIGNCGLLEKDIDAEKENEVVYVLARRVWGQGFASEITRALVGYAFDTLALSRVVALIDPANIASGRVAEKAGLSHHRDTLRPSGKIMRVYEASRE